MKYLFIFIFITNSILYALSSNDLKKIEERNREILLQDKERELFEKNSEEKKINNIKKEFYQVDKNITKTGNCFLIENFTFHDNKIVNSNELSDIVSSYQNQCLNPKHIENILKTVNNYYIEKGYITSKAYLKNQNLSTKTLHIYILEGKIDTIYINGEKGVESITAFPNLEEDILNLRDIEMGLEQINRLYRNQAKLKLQASDKEGYSNINITNQEDKAIYGTASTGTNGLQTTGKETGSIQLNLENPIGLNSKITFGLNGALKQSKEKKSRGVSLNYSIPYGYFLFSAGYRQFLYRSTIYGEKDNYISSGESTNYNYNIDYTLYRDSDTILKASSNLNIGQNLNFIANELIKISSTKLTTGSIGLSASHNLENTSINLNLTMHKGLDLFDPVINSNDKNYEFTKYTSILSLNSNFTLYDIPLNINSTLSGQYSNDRLYSQELFSMGGFYTIRGFNYTGYYGEIGVYAHNDLTYKTSLSLFGKDINISPYIGLDFGVMEYDKDIFKHMIGSGFGLKTSLYGFNLGFDFGIPLYSYDPIIEEEIASSFSINYQY